MPQAVFSDSIPIAGTISGAHWVRNSSLFHFWELLATQPQIPQDLPQTGGPPRFPAPSPRFPRICPKRGPRPVSRLPAQIPQDLPQTGSPPVSTPFPGPSPALAAGLADAPPHMGRGGGSPIDHFLTAVRHFSPAEVWRDIFWSPGSHPPILYQHIGVFPNEIWGYRGTFGKNTTFTRVFSRETPKALFFVRGTRKVEIPLCGGTFEASDPTFRGLRPHFSGLRPHFSGLRPHF